jgi:hypothetical protein
VLASSPNPCQNGGVCTCAPGFTGTTCQTNVNLVAYYPFTGNAIDATDHGKNGSVDGTGHTRLG